MQGNVGREVGEDRHFQAPSAKEFAEDEREASVENERAHHQQDRKRGKSSRGWQVTEPES